MNPRISVVIPTRNDAAALARTVEWLRNLPGIREAELIVAASGDPLGTIHALGGRIQLLWPGGSTRATLMNAGAASAGGDVLFFVHADSLPPANALASIDDALADDRVVGGAFEHRFAESHWSLRAISWINRIRYRFTRNYYGDQGLFVRASTFRALGGYRDLPLLEDLDFSRRLKCRGRTVLVRAPMVTSGRRFLANGPWRTLAFIAWLLCRYSLRLGTARYAERWRGPADASPGSPWPSHRRRLATWREITRRMAGTTRRDVFPIRTVESTSCTSSPHTGQANASGGRG